MLHNESVVEATAFTVMDGKGNILVNIISFLAAGFVGAADHWSRTWLSRMSQVVTGRQFFHVEICVTRVV